MINGGLFTIGFGLITMLLEIGLPAVLIIVLIWDLTHHGIATKLTHLPVYQSISSPRFCSRCGTTLHVGWSHCPQCGAQT